MAHRKGNCYNEKDAVADAIAQMKWTAKKFFAHAKTFTGINGFDATEAAKGFEEEQADPPPPVVAFANWVLTKNPKDVHARFN